MANTLVAKKPKPKLCDACGIRVGEGCLETQFHTVGSFEICDTCYGYINKYGFLQIEERSGKRLMLDGMVQRQYINSNGVQVKNPRYLPKGKSKE